MRQLSTRIATLAVSATIALASAVSSYAMPLPAAAVSAPGAALADVQPVQWRHGYGYGYGPRPYYGGGWYRGYRGYPHYRDGYRYYNGYWFPLAAFGAGAIIGGAIASEPRYYATPAPGGDINPRHFEWCAARYRSYRAFDNTFQPNSGPRQQCYSPYF